MDSDTIRYGIVGCAGIGETHAAAVAAADGAALVAFCDLDETTAREYAETHSVEWYTDVTAMIEESAVDAVSVCTPSGTHSAVTIDCAKAGADVLCEKPLDVTPERIDAMIETAEREGVVLAGVFQRRTHDAVQRAKQAIDDGELGELVLGDATTKWYRTQGYYDSADWRGTHELDGGCLMNQGIHNIDKLQWLMGGVERVYAMTDTRVHEMDAEDVAAVSVRFANGALGTIEATTSVRGGESSVEINGSTGSITIEGNAITHFETENGDIETESLPATEFGEAHAIVVQDFVDALREDRTPMVPAREARTAVDIVLAAYRSVERDEVVAVDDLNR